MRSIVSVAAVLASSAIACTPDLTESTLVDGPRVLAMIAERPAAHPGDTVTLRVMHGGFAHTPSIAWRWCVRHEETSSTLPLGSYGEFHIDRGCDSDGAAGTMALPAGASSSLTIPTSTLTRLDLLRAAYGNLSDATLLRLGHEVGMSILVEVLLEDGETALRAIKRVPVFDTGTEGLNTNPPAPSFAFYGHALGLEPGGDPLRCVSLDGAPIHVAHGSTVRLEPATDESWREEYAYVDANGVTVSQLEEATYAVYANAGSWNLGRARMPDRDPAWTAPATGSTVNAWFVVRDGRGGSSACEFEFTVDP